MGASETQDPPALSAEIVQERGDVRDGVVGIVVTNESDVDVVVDHAEYRSSALVEPLVGGDDSSIPAGATRALRGELPTPTCDDGPIVDEVVVVLDDGTEVTLDPGDPYDQIPTLTEAPCTRLDVEAVVDVEWLPIEVPEPALGADATVSIRLTPTGAGELAVQSVDATVLLAVVDAAGERATTVPLGATITADGDAQTIAFTVRPGRCDAHAIAEDKQGTIFVFQVMVDGEPRTLQLPSDDATRDALLGYAAASCGLD
ncbi:hypothetical protein [Agrococcus jejuensis]|uniref:Uncharacterized protein n=1 Tax=Agrococcus jejuensis TaxID=399736 RepID=A0A1G8FRK4_9MICO|nr:hypothetical protein [Agrococcus jejuensis]SDH84747.1 hypothetical protein SAMN04489720_2588 [Agrococcus jejuensis]